MYSDCDNLSITVKGLKQRDEIKSKFTAMSCPESRLLPLDLLDDVFLKAICRSCTVSALPPVDNRILTLISFSYQNIQRSSSVCNFL